eukprot:jgi/Bigna1/83563/fgenesh1_pg.110_\
MFSGGTFDQSYNDGSQHPRDKDLCLIATRLGISPRGSRMGGEGCIHLYMTDGEGGTPMLLSQSSKKGIFHEVTRIGLHSLTTGHGWGLDSENCAEFCPSQHLFRIEAMGITKRLLERIGVFSELGGLVIQKEEALLEFAMAGSDTGCLQQIESGVTPNQAGTWTAGRAGWCPGSAVQPTLLAVDMENIAHKLNAVVVQQEDEGGGAIEEIRLIVRASYRGFYNGKEYTPESSTFADSQGFPAEIKLSSALSLWRDETISIPMASI